MFALNFEFKYWWVKVWNRGAIALQTLNNQSSTKKSLKFTEKSLQKLSLFRRQFILKFTLLQKAFLPRPCPW